MTLAVLTPAQRDELADRGVVALRGFAPEPTARHAAEAVMQALAAAGLWTPGAFGPVWPGGGVNVKRLGVRPPEVESAFSTPDMAALARELLQGGAPDRAIWKRPQLLVTLPNPPPRPLPTGWHTDFPHLGRPGRSGAQVFMCLDEVAAGGAATWVVAGSHRLVGEGRALATADVHARLRRWDYFKALYAGAYDPTSYRDRIDGVDVSVVELSGRPGDLFVMDPRVLHSASPNARAQPRIMATDRFVTAEAAAEMMAVV